MIVKLYFEIDQEYSCVETDGILKDEELEQIARATRLLVGKQNSYGNLIETG